MTDFGERRRVLPKTGQTTSYRDGDDGDLEKGWDEGERFKDVGDGTIVDNATGLMWPKDWSGDGGNGGNAPNWNNAIDWALGLSFAGYNDWRLPNFIELASIYSVEGAAPLVCDIFENVASDDYWTSSSNPLDPSYKTYIGFNIFNIYFALSFLPKMVVAVRDI